jgi:hypothetical protein
MNRIKSFYRSITFLIFAKLFPRYYIGVGMQARYLYRQSLLFKYRWKEMGLDHAESSFEKGENEQVYFFRKAQQEPFLIRARIFYDALLKREPKAYYKSIKTIIKTSLDKRSGIFLMRS